MSERYQKLVQAKSQQGCGERATSYESMRAPPPRPSSCLSPHLWVSDFSQPRFDSPEACSLLPDQLQLPPVRGKHLSRSARATISSRLRTSQADAVSLAQCLGLTRWTAYSQLRAAHFTALDPPTPRLALRRIVPTSRFSNGTAPASVPRLLVNRTSWTSPAITVRHALFATGELSLRVGRHFAPGARWSSPCETTEADSLSSCARCSDPLSLENP